MQSAPRRLSGLSELLPAHRQPDYQYQAPYSAPPGPYDVPRLRRTGSIAGSYVSTVPSSAGLNTPASSFRHLADASPRRDSYYSVHSEDGEHSQRSNSPVDTVHSRHSGNDRDTPSPASTSRAQRSVARLRLAGRGTLASSATSPAVVPTLPRRATCRVRSFVLASPPSDKLIRSCRPPTLAHGRAAVRVPGRVRQGVHAPVRPAPARGQGPPGSQGQPTVASAA
jgi:hypothetical protein